MEKNDPWEPSHAWVYNVDDEGLNVRSGKGTNFKILDVIQCGTMVYEWLVDGNWTKIYERDGVGYWVYNTYLTGVMQNNVFEVKGADSEGLNVRNSKSTSGKVLNTIKNGTRVAIYNLNPDGSKPTWAKVSPNSERYCYSQYLVKTDSRPDFEPK